MPDWIVPTLPSSFTGIEGIYTAAIIGVLKLVRARWLRKRSAYIDRFGWSIIAFDYVLGVVLTMIVMFSFYPGLNILGSWYTHISDNLIALVAIWQLVEIRLASNERVQAAVGGLTNGHAPLPPDDYYEGPDRRTGDPDRRREGMIARGLI